MQSTKIPNLKIKQAVEDDVPLILSFIKELAEYEKLSHEVTATEGLLKKALFGEKAYAETLIAYLEGRPAAFALYFHNFSTFLGRPGIYLEDVFVKPEFRSRGIGRTLLSYLAKLAKERCCGRIEWAVLDWNESAIDFYDSIGARPMDSWIVNRISGAALETLADEF